MITITSAPALNTSLAMPSQDSAHQEVITPPNTPTTRHTMSLGADRGWDIYIRKDGDGIKVDKPLWRDVGSGRENRPPAPPPEISGYQYQGETTQRDVSTLTYVPKAIADTVGGTAPHPAENSNNDAWASSYPFGLTNTLARTLASSPAQSLERVMYASAQAVGAVVEIEPDGQVNHLGTGFLAASPYMGDSSIYVVTNDHVIRAGNGSNRYELWLGYENPNGAPRERIQLSGQSAGNAGLDYAIFRVKNEDGSKAIGFRPLPFDPSGSAFVGDDIYMPNHAAGSVKGISYKDSSGRNSQILRTTSDLGAKYPGQVLVHGAFNMPGTSGSPIIDRRTNNVIALNFGGIGQGMAVNMSTVWKDARPQLQGEA